MRLPSCVLLAMLASASASLANIGETQTEIEGRLGKPVALEDGATIYQKDGFRIEVVYQKGTSVVEVVRMFPPGKGIPNETRAMLFTVYGKGQVWNQLDAEKAWSRADGKAVAALDESLGYLGFFDVDYLREVQQHPSAARRFTDTFGPIPTPAPATPAP